MKNINNFLQKLYSGRIGRKYYFLGLLVLGLFFGGVSAMFAFNGPNRMNIFTFALNIIGAVFLFALHARRWHDLGQSGWWALVLFIPMVNFFVELYLIFAKGVAGKNEFGDPLPPDTKFLDAILNKAFR